MDYSTIQTEKDLAELEKELRKLYKQAQKDVEKIYNRYMMGYDEYDEDGKKIHHKGFYERDKEMREALENGTYPELYGANSGLSPEEHYKQWRLNQIARGSHWELIRDEMAMRYVDANKIASAYINDRTPSIYSLNYNYSAFRIEGANVGISFELVNEQAVRELMMGNNHVNFKTISHDRVRDYYWNANKIQQVLVSGIVQGKAVHKIANDFLKVMGNNEAAARRNARTSYGSAMNAGRNESFKRAKEMGIVLFKEWIATEDKRTRDSHAHLNGVRVKVGTDFPNGLEYPKDPKGAPSEVYNCRCSMKGIIPKYNGDPKLAKYWDKESGTWKERYNDVRAYEKWLKEKQKNANRNHSR